LSPAASRVPGHAQTHEIVPVSLPATTTTGSSSLRWSNLLLRPD
jgi:hypothetical protein